MGKIRGIPVKRITSVQNQTDKTNTNTENENTTDENTDTSDSKNL